MQQYLKTMGIETWTLRDNASVSLPACYAYELFADDQPVGLMIAQAAVADAAIEELLHKMMAALKCRWQGQWYEVQPDCSEMADLRFVIVLGDGFETEVFEIPVIQSYAPLHLLAEPKLKADTWKSMQAVFPLIADK